MGVNEWPGGQWKTAGVYWRYEASNSKLLLIEQGMQMVSFNKSNKIKRADQISATVVWKDIPEVAKPAPCMSRKS